MNLGDLFGCTYVINLPERKDRRKAILRELEQLGMPLTPGKLEIFSAVRPSDAAGFPSPGVRGCFLSHLGVLKEAQRRKLPAVLILEDDLTFSPLILLDFSALRFALEHQMWDFVYLGHVEKVPSETPLALVPFSGPLVTAHFYGVNGSILDPLIEYLELVLTRPPGHPLGGPMHFDGALTMFRQANPTARTLIAQPNLGWQRSSRSDLHSNWFQQAPVFGEMYDAARLIRRLVTKRG